MEHARTPNYLRIKQICKNLGLDRKQLLYEIEENNLNVSISLAFRAGRLNRGNVKIYEEQINNLTGEVIKEYVPHNGYVELYDASFMDPRKSLADLLNGNDALIWKIKCNGRKCFLEPPIAILSKDIYMHYMETSKIGRVQELTQTYKGDDVNIAVVNIILPELLPDKKQSLSSNQKNELCLIIFSKLTDVLNTNRAVVSNNLPTKNKKDGEIKGKDKKGNPIKLSFEALERRVKNSLLDSYMNNHRPI